MDISLYSVYEGKENYCIVRDERKGDERSRKGKEKEKRRKEKN